MILDSLPILSLFFSYQRNLTREQVEISIGRRYIREKKSHGGDRSKLQNLQLDKTETALAEEYKVSPRTIHNYAKKAEEFDLLTFYHVLIKGQTDATLYPTLSEIVDPGASWGE